MFCRVRSHSEGTVGVFTESTICEGNFLSRLKVMVFCL